MERQLQLAALKEILKDKEVMAKIREIDTPEKFATVVEKSEIDPKKVPIEKTYKQFKKIAEIKPGAGAQMNDAELEAVAGGEPGTIALIVMAGIAAAPHIVNAFSNLYKTIKTS